MPDISDNKFQTIDELEEVYPDEWLLVKIREEDAQNQPTKGILMAHSKAKDEIVEMSRKLRDDIAIFYSGNIPKKGYAFCF